MRVAALYDVHGNVHALDAVLTGDEARRWVEAGLDVEQIEEEALAVFPS